TAESIITTIDKYFHNFIEETSLAVDKIAAVGIAPQGIIDSAKGRCLLGTHLGGVVNLDLGNRLKELFRLPIFVDDPVRAMTYFEKKHGKHKNVKNFIYIFLGKGVGSGIVINNKIYRGHRGIAGEIGHIMVDNSGARCKCGNYGCLETIASRESIIRQIKEGVEDRVFTRIMDICHNNVDKIDLYVLEEAAAGNDKFSLNILDHVGSYLGKAVTMLMLMFNPETIIISGEGAILSKYLIDSINRTIKKNTLSIINEETHVQFLEYNKFLGSTGIAIEAFDMLFDYAAKEAKCFINNLIGIV
ncbi:MAG: ROK family protein, partial [Spirochaetota bacterium]